MYENHAKKFCSKTPVYDSRYELATASQAVSVAAAMHQLSETDLPVCMLSLTSFLSKKWPRERDKPL